MDQHSIPDLEDLFCSCRSSHPRCSVRKGALRNFTNFLGKHLSQRLWQRCFPVNFVKFFTQHLLATASVLMADKTLQCSTNNKNIAYTLFLISDTFVSNTRLTVAKNTVRINFCYLKNIYPRYHPKIIRNVRTNV